MKHLNKIDAERYSYVAKLMHWTIAVLVFTNYTLGLSLDDTHWYNIHKQIGFSILLLVIIRVVYRLSRPYPAPVVTLSKFEKILSIGVHRLLYVFMLIVPLSGLIMGLCRKVMASLNQLLNIAFLKIQGYSLLFLSFYAAINSN